MLHLSLHTAIVCPLMSQRFPNSGVHQITRQHRKKGGWSGSMPKTLIWGPRNVHFNNVLGSLVAGGLWGLH